MKKHSATIDGRKLMFGPLLCVTLEEHQDAIGRMTRGEVTNPAEVCTLATNLATASLQRVDPKITRDQVAGWVDLSNAEEFYAAAFGVSLPAVRSGEKRAAAR